MFKLGEKSIKKLYLGEKPIVKAYLGNKLLFQAIPPKFNVVGSPAIIGPIYTPTSGGYISSIDDLPSTGIVTIEFPFIRTNEWKTQMLVSSGDSSSYAYFGLFNGGVGDFMENSYNSIANSGGTQQNLPMFTYIENNVEYTVKLSINQDNNGSTNIAIFKDGSQIGSTTWFALNGFTHKLYIGYFPEQPDNYFEGTIDLSRFVVTHNGELWWKPIA